MRRTANGSPTSHSLSANVWHLVDFDKVMILDFKNAGKWSPDGEAFGGFSWEDWEAKMLSELPAFIHWLLNEYRVPEHMGINATTSSTTTQRWNPSSPRRLSTRYKPNC